MGGCATKPKTLEKDETLPVENPESPKAEAVPEVNSNEVESKKEEEPLVDISEPAKEEEAKKSDETLAKLVGGEEEAKPVVAVATMEESIKEEPEKNEPVKEEPEKKESEIVAVVEEEKNVQVASPKKANN